MSIGSSRLSVEQHGEEEWIVVEAPEPEATEDKPVELVPSSDGAPLHLVRRSRLSTIGAWTPERRIERAFTLGQQDCQAVLDGTGQQAKDSFPIASAIYCILYEPSGNWPRITRSIQRFYEEVKVSTDGKAPGRYSQWRPGFYTRGILNLHVVGSESGNVDLLILKWGDAAFLAVPLRVCRQGVILALPKEAIPEDTLEDAMDGPGDGLVGPHLLTTVNSQASDEEEGHVIELLIVEFAMPVRLQLDRKTPRTRRQFVGFVGDHTILPDFGEINEIVSSWVEGGEARLEDYFTAAEEAPPAQPGDQNLAILAQLQELQATMDRRFQELESRVPQAVVPASQGSVRAPPTRPSNKGGGEEPNGPGPRDRNRALLESVREQAGPPPPRLADEPGRGAETARQGAHLRKLVEDVDPETSSVDDLMKLALLKMVQGTKSKKGRRLPGLPNLEDSSDSERGEGEQSWSSTSKGGRGIEAVERLNQAMKSYPDAYSERMEARMAKAVESAELLPTVPMLFARSCRKSRTAGYCLQGFANVHRLLLENKPQQARLQVLRIMGALEQFLIDENWLVASRLTGMEEPPWGHWATQDLGALRRQYVYSRLAESTWIGALINELKEEEWLTKKKFAAATPKPKAKGGGGGERRKRDREHRFLSWAAPDVPRRGAPLGEPHLKTGADDDAATVLGPLEFLEDWCRFLEGADLYRDPVPYPESGFLEGVMIDDHLGLQLLKRLPSMKRTLEQPARDQEVFASSASAYDYANLMAHPKKKQRRSLHVKAWGAEIEGGRGLVGPARRRLFALSRLSAESAKPGSLDLGEETCPRIPVPPWLWKLRTHIDVLCEWLEEFMITMFLEHKSRRAASDLALPGDHFDDEVIYVRMGQPKTRHRAAASQHVRVDHPGVASWVADVLPSTPAWRKIWNGSWAAFKLRFDALQTEVLESTPCLPSSLRPGAATFLFRSWDENLPRLQWRGRWKSFRMLETYVQELGATEVKVGTLLCLQFLA
ncbi:hypothetical protein AK812_SmicGene21120 [Symbiodinium microadriaticum]|uniref:Uncharacterized protein n=1 Tax=Symbiodinium microadriaticum TaxID=2951 RepID=A0A1Q9DN92_SYMMI|nr:hypothetical protein AK812_SmicGene21120 [Symbiodinium microadriaticum]